MKITLHMFMKKNGNVVHQLEHVDNKHGQKFASCLSWVAGE